MKNYVIGLDYGTDSLRALLVDTGSGEEMATNTFYYPQWQDKKYCNEAMVTEVDFALKPNITRTLQIRKVFLQ